jgi:large subunit ribosomal protein L5
MSYTPRLYKKYKEEVAPQLVKDFDYESKMEVPRLVKISINQGLGEATQDKKIIEEALEELSVIAGQKAIPTRAKQSVSNFKLREGMTIGTKVTLRKNRMYEFLDRLITVALPRVRDFRGVSDKSFDGRGNYNLGLTEQIIFPEINMDKVNKLKGMQVTFVTTAETDAEAFALLKQLGVPFRNQNN